MWKELHNKELPEQLLNKKPDFLCLMLFPTMSCDCRCKMCNFWGDRGYYSRGAQDGGKKQLDFKSIKKLLEESLKEKNRYFVTLGGGEPLLYKNFKQLAQFLNGKKLPFIVMTNGSQLKKHLDTIEQNVTALSVSIDGPPEVHDSIRGRKRIFNDALEGIEALLRIKIKKKKSMPFIFINCTLTEHSVGHLHDFIAAIKSRLEPIGAKLRLEEPKTLSSREVTIHFEPLLFTTETLGKKYADEMKSLFDCDVTDSWKPFAVDDINIDIEKLKKDLLHIYNDFRVNSSEFIDLREYFLNIHNVFGYTRCRSPFHTMIVNEDGEAYFCPSLLDYSLGNISESSFHDLWHGLKAERFRKEIRKRNLSICNRCCFLFADYSYIRRLFFFDSIFAKLYYWIVNHIPALPV